VGDFNGDGKQDLAVVNVGPEFDPGSVSILLGNGDGTFQAAVNYAVGVGAVAIAAGDFDGDGKLDLVVSNNYYSSNDLSILFGNGDGTFQPAVSFSQGFSGVFIAAADFNGDGKLDLAVSTGLGGNSVGILLGNGDGTFQAPTTYAAGNEATPIAVADFNGDGKLDLAVGDTFAVAILLGNGDGTFQPATYNNTYGGQSIAIADFNGDGKPDLALSSQSAGYAVGILLGNGDGTFQPAMRFAAGQVPYFVAVGDFNGDGRQDLAVANEFNTVSILTNKTR